MPTTAQAAKTLFKDTFGEAPSALFQAPGRVNLIGGHTDYNEGLVLPAAINFHTVIAVSPAEDDCIHAVSARFNDKLQSWPIGTDDSSCSDWFHYLTGVCRSFSQSGLTFKGMKIAIASNVPINTGLASSAALEIAFAMALNELNQLSLSPLALAQLAQRGEYQYVGFECGLMDHVTSACAQDGHALLIDCMDMDPEPVAIPDNLSLMIIKPNQALKRSSAEYSQRRQQCQQAAEYFGLASLRELLLEELEAAKGDMPVVLYKRALHVLKENDRVYQASKALNRGQLAKFSQIMAESHASMRDLFELSVPEIDVLVETMQQALGEHGGVRITGGGVGGCVVALVDHDYTDAVFDAIETQFSPITGVDVTTYLCHPSAGAHPLALD
ncbi:galactokinase [Paraferrimonas sedimenticola]|uniref:Galactokinase n=1 Tax=Paraferrimonas sedimenticola TaxID=375674 RepID=A0AA37RUU1_9GAMM|nr:galactokinase [Paraferrimonas sedimenticola]GLP95764.1 galactokinase [Paraferrimonas sedimenticola]